jgi:hypothetical protein
VTAVYWTATTGWNVPAACDTFSYVYCLGGGSAGTAGAAGSGLTGGRAGNGGGSGQFCQTNNIYTTPGAGWSIYVGGQGGYSGLIAGGSPSWTCLAYSSNGQTGASGGTGNTVYGGQSGATGTAGITGMGGNAGGGGNPQGSPWGASGGGAGGIGAYGGGGRPAQNGGNATNWGAAGGGGGGGSDQFGPGAGGGAYQGITQLDYNTRPPPTVSGISPNSGAIQGGSYVNITGSGFSRATGATIGGAAVSGFTINSDTAINCQLPGHAAGAVDVSVTNYGGTGTLVGGYTYKAAPVLSSISPTKGPIAGGTTVILTGSGFTGASSVTFGGTAASYTVNSDTKITATAPAHYAYDYNAVSVVTALGTTGYYYYAYIAPPAITSCSPTKGVQRGGESVTITGTDFREATSVTFDGIAATNIAIDYYGYNITCTTPVHPVGTATIAVTTPYGSASMPNAYAFRAVVYSNLAMLGF